MSEDRRPRAGPVHFIAMKLVGIRPGEEKLAFLLFSYFFLITAPHTIIKALRTTDLLWKEGVGALPLAYLSAAVVTGLVVLFHSKIQFKISIEILIIGSLVFFAVSGLALQLILLSEYGQRSRTLPYLYWVWASVLIVVLMTHFWMTVNEIFNPREAKRLIAFVSSGGILGGILGGLLAGVLTGANLAQWLLPLACGLLIGCVFVVRAVFRDRQRASAAKPVQPGKAQMDAPKAGFKDSFNAVRKDSYLVLIAAVVVIGIIVSTLIEFQFFSAASEHYTNPRNMQAFFGFFFAGLTILALFLNIFLTGNFIKKLGVRATVLLTPVVLFLCSLVVLVFPFSLYPAIFIKGSDESLAFSLNQTIREILYIPVASSLKSKAKPFIDMFISRVAKVAAAIILLAFALLLNKEVDYLTPIFDPGLAKQLSWVVIAFLVPWGVFSLKLGKEYVAAINRSIKMKWDRVDQSVREQVDVDSAKDIFDAMESRNRSAILYAMHVFDLLQRDKLSPEIKNMIAEKAGEVRGSSLSDLFNAEGAAGFPEAAEDIRREDLVTDIRETMSLDAYQELMERHAGNVMAESQKSEVEKMELAKAIGLMSPDAPLTDRLEALIDDHSPDVACYALKSAARLKKERYLPAIIRKLGPPSTREDAISALHKYGRAAVPVLEENLRDRYRELNIRKAVVETLARLATEEAAFALAEELELGGGELDPDVIEALDRIRTEKGVVQLPARVAKRKTFSLVHKYCRAFLDLQELGSGEDNDTARRRMERELETLFSDIFKLLGLYYPHEEIRKAYQNIETGTRNSIAYAIELLDNTLKKDIRDLIIPLVEDLSPAERQRSFQKILKNSQ
ncbi:MAG: Npt1/Npt2 family nucleotide transporter [Candidatus Aminicenantales bacterium]